MVVHRSRPRTLRDRGDEATFGLIAEGLTHLGAPDHGWLGPWLVTLDDDRALREEVLRHLLGLAVHHVGFLARMRDLPAHLVLHELESLVARA